jgi:hypothetical protein
MSPLWIYECDRQESMFASTFKLLQFRREISLEYIRQSLFRDYVADPKTIIAKLLDNSATGVCS